MKPKRIKRTAEEKQNKVMAKFAYRGFEILCIDTTEDHTNGEDWVCGQIVDPKDGLTLPDYFEEASSVADIKDGAWEWIDRQLDAPKEARKRLKECDTATLLNIFYSYATSAPAWADEVMEMVAERKKRAWLIGQITDMLSESELVEEMGV